MMFEDFFSPKGFDDDVEFMPLFSVDEGDEASPNETYSETLPLLALKNTVLFPGIVIPITVGRDKSLKAIHKAYEADRMIAVLSQKDSKVEDPSSEDLYEIGTVARIIKLLKMPDGTATAILQGRKRFALGKIIRHEPYLQGEISVIEESAAEDGLEFDALVASIKDRAKEIIELSPQIPSEAVVILKNIDKDSFLLNFIASNLGIKNPAKQQILETNGLHKKAEVVLEHMENELQLLQLKDKIEGKVRGDIEKQQRDSSRGF